MGVPPHITFFSTVLEARVSREYRPATTLRCTLKPSFANLPATVSRNSLGCGGTQAKRGRRNSYFDYPLMGNVTHKIEAGPRLSSTNMITSKFPILRHPPKRFLGRIRSMTHTICDQGTQIPV